MKSTILAALVILAGAAFAAESAKYTLAEASEQIAAVVANPEKMGDVTRKLSAAEQLNFLIAVNKAVKNMPGSNELKTAKYLQLEREAMLAAKAGNLQKLVAVMFRTVPLESLTVLAERYSEDLFNRAADATKTFTDEQFTEIASSTVGEIHKACEGMPDAGPRDVLAIYLFGKASNGSPVDLEDILLNMIPDPEVRELAKNEWLPAAHSSSASGSGDDRFSSMLAYADAGRAPNTDVTTTLAGPQVIIGVLTDLGNCVTDSNGDRINPITVGENPGDREKNAGGAAEAAENALSSSRPVTDNPNAPWNPERSRSDNQGGGTSGGGGYQWQD